MADENLMNQEEIERLLGQVKVKEGGPAGAKEASAAAPEPPPAAAPKTVPPAATAKPTPAPAEDESKVLRQNDIEKLLSQAGRAPAKPTAQPAAVKEKELASSPIVGEGEIASADVEYLLSQAEKALASIGGSADSDLAPGVAAFRLEEFSGAPASTEATTFDLIRDVELDLKIELGRTHMYLEDVLKLRKGSVVPLDKLAGDPVDIYVNGRLIARGEVLVLNDNFCVRVAELIVGTNVFA